MARAGTPTTQGGLWGGYEMLDRSPLLNEDGTTDILDRDLAETLVSQLGDTAPQGLRAFLNELLPEIGISSLDDLGGYELAEILEGIF